MLQFSKIKYYTILFGLFFAQLLIFKTSIPCFAQINYKIDSITSIINKQQNDSAKGNLYVSLAKHYKSNDISKAAIMCDSAIFYLKKANEFEKLAYAIGLKGSLEINKGNYPLAFEHINKAQNIFNELKNESGIGYTYALLGLFYYYQGPHFFELARAYNLKAVNIFEKNKNDKLQTAALLNLGNLYGDPIFLQHYNLDSAVFFYEKALALCKKSYDEAQYAHILSALGHTYATQNKLSKATEYQELALKIQDSINDISGKAYTLFRIATLYARKGQMDKGILTNLKAIEEAKKVNNKDLMNNIHEVLSEWYDFKGNYKLALEHYRKSVELKFQLYNQERVAKIAEYQTKYETEKKEKEIIMLNRDKEQQQIELLKKEAELNKRRAISNAVSVGLILVIILAIVIYRGYRSKRMANVLLAKQKDEIDKKNKHITSSIKYAQRIQNAVLPSEEQLHKAFSDYFLLYLPKDIVSGDFYFLEQRQDKVIFAVGDCTGHGVPGSFMSILTSNILNSAVNEYKLSCPQEIMLFLNKQLFFALHKQESNTQINDGVDLIITVWDTKSNILHWSGARNYLFHFTTEEKNFYKADQISIGHQHDLPLEKISKHTIKLQIGDLIYLFSDGYQDQFSTDGLKKFSFKAFKNLIAEISTHPLNMQKEILQSLFYQWKGNFEQIDDVLVYGWKV